MFYRHICCVCSWFKNNNNNKIIIIRCVLLLWSQRFWVVYFSSSKTVMRLLCSHQTWFVFTFYAAEPFYFLFFPTFLGWGSGAGGISVRNSYNQSKIWQDTWYVLVLFWLGNLWVYICVVKTCSFQGFSTTCPFVIQKAGSPQQNCLTNFFLTKISQTILLRGSRFLNNKILFMIYGMLLGWTKTDAWIRVCHFSSNEEILKWTEGFCYKTEAGRVKLSS